MTQGRNITSEAMKNPFWIAGLALNLFAIVIHSVVAFNFIFYIVQLYKERKAKGPTTKNRGFKIHVCAVASVILPYIRYSSTQAMIWVSYYGIDLCNTMRCIGVLAFVTATTPSYLFLWLRQRLFYSHPLLTVVSGPCVNRLSLAALVFWCIVAVVEMCVSIVLPFRKPVIQVLKPSTNGCVSNEKQTWAYYLPFVYGSSFFVLQGMLLGLFVYPLCLHYKGGVPLEKVSLCQPTSRGTIELNTYQELGGRNSLGCDSGDNSEIEVDRTRNHQLATERSSVKDEMKAIIYKNAALAVVWMSCDVITAIVAVSLPKDAPQSFLYAVYDWSVLIDSTAVVCSFSEWKRIVLPCVSSRKGI